MLSVYFLVNLLWMCVYHFFQHCRRAPLRPFSSCVKRTTWYWGATAAPSSSNSLPRLFWEKSSSPEEGWVGVYLLCFICIQVGVNVLFIAPKPMLWSHKTVEALHSLVFMWLRLSRAPILFMQQLIASIVFLLWSQNQSENACVLITHFPNVLNEKLWRAFDADRSIVGMHTTIVTRFSWWGTDK